jgi:hypothetical protein
MTNEKTLPLIKKIKSVPLAKAEKKALKEYRKKFETETGCAIALGIDRNVLNRVLLAGSGSPETIERIKTVLLSN